MARAEARTSPLPENLPAQNPEQAVKDGIANVPDAANREMTTAEVTQERGFAKGSVFERLNSDGKSENWKIDQVTANGTVLMSFEAENGKVKHAMISKAELQMEREIVEKGLKAEEYFEPMVDLLSDGDETKKAFFREHKGRILEIGGGNYANVAEALNEVYDDYFASQNTEADQKLRAGAQNVHVLNAVNRELGGGTQSAEERSEVLKDTIDDPRAQQILLNREVEAPAKLKTVEEIKALILENRKKAYAVLNDPNSSIEAMQQTKNMVLDGINELRFAEGRAAAKEITDLDHVTRAFYFSMDEKIAKARKAPVRAEMKAETQPVIEIPATEVPVPEKIASIDPSLMADTPLAKERRNMRAKQSARKAMESMKAINPSEMQEVAPMVESAPEAAQAEPKKVAEKMPEKKAAPRPKKVAPTAASIPTRAPKSPTISEAAKTPSKGFFGTLGSWWDSLMGSKQ